MIQMLRLRQLLLILGLGIASPVLLLASDPPHDTTKSVQCKSCHTLHMAPAAVLTNVAGNANLCMSCHNSVGTAATKPFVTGDQALPGSGLPTGVTPVGTSHRWDSSAAGHLVKGTPNTSAGSIKLSGAYSGAYATTIQIKISTAGQVGVAKFDWQMTTGGTTTWGVATTAVATAATPVAIGTTGISVTFVNHLTTNPSFVLNDIYLVYARTQIRVPVDANMARLTENGQIMCSTCHNQHLQANKPFDPTSSATYTAGVTNNRHFLRLANDTGQMCADCHNARNVTVKGGSSHPVTLPVPATADFKVPTTAVLDSTSKVECQSCHKIHYAPTTDGTLLRVSNAANLLCEDCHTLRTVANKGVHFAATNGVVWPGGEAHTLGTTTIPATTYAARLATERGSCANCHVPHGWPDTADATKRYPHMLVENPSTLCLTCHDATPQVGATNVELEIVKTTHHPVERPANFASGRTVTCGDCHNPHKALATPAAAADSKSHKYATVATATRNQILVGTTGPLMGADGVVPTYATNWTAPTYVATTTATIEGQVCMKCHTSTATSFGATPPAGLTPLYAVGTAKFTNASTAVTGTGTTWNAGMVGAWMHKSANTPAYRIAAFVSATSLTLATPYAQATDAAAAAYLMTQETDVGMEFNTKNASYHPVMGGLTGGGSSALTVALTTTWNTAKGTQTMMCSDCHNTDSASTAAQGPHGSAAQFMLRNFGTGTPPPANWPAVTITNARGATVANQSWCNNCHAIQTATNNAHSNGKHNSVQCFNCHLVVPHGGKIGRLIATNTANMPARYAYNNLKTNSYLRAFVKTTSSAYQESNCGSAQSGCNNHSLATSATNSW
jgi:predicted CXXCH cytochrome family protein